MIAALHRLPRIVAAIAAGLVLAMLSVDAAKADSRFCRQLEAELASASRGERSTAKIRRYDRSIGKQLDQIGKARIRARRAGCSRSLFGIEECAGLNAKMERMERNLEALRRKRTDAANGNDRVRARILASLEANRCRGGLQAERGGDLRDHVPGSGLQQRALREGLDEGRAGVRILPAPLDSSGGGRSAIVTVPPPPRHFRTLCVRICDGFFFPMSPAASSSDFPSDQRNCEARCPGADMQVYHHRLSGEQAADMVSSASGAPYADLPTAYLYRKPGTPRPANCGCNAGKNFEILGNSQAGQSSGAAPAEDAPHDAGKARTGKVRVVGPAFLPDPQEAIDLRAPAPRQDR